MKGAKNWKEVQERLKGQTVTYFDFETTGIADYDGQDITNDPVQLGAVQVKDGKIVKRFNVYTNPESKLSEWSAKNLGRDILDENGNRILDENGKPTTTPVTPEWLAEQANQEQALRDFIEFIGPNALLGGQNVPFDVEILKRMADKSGIDLDIAGTIDSKDLASLLPKYDAEKGIDGPKAPDRKTGEIKATSSLGPVANFLGFEPANWHSADGDAEDSYNLVSKIIDRAANEDNQDLNLLDFPAMQKRYEERMAEFKDVVSPDSPTTDNQKKALEQFSNSDNPEIAAKAEDALASASTRGEAADSLRELHALENEFVAPDVFENEGPEAPQINSNESDSDFSPEVSENEGPSEGPQFNADESDSDFDDVEVEFDVPVQKATAPVDYSVVSAAIDDLTEKYGPTIATTSEIDERDIITLSRLANEVNEAANNYKQTQDANDKKLYMSKLLEMLDFRSGIIHKANSYSLSNRNSVADSKISGDPLLSTGELALINSKITPRNSLGTEIKPTGPLGPTGEQRRRETSVLSMSQLRADLTAKDAKAPKINGLPDNWQLYGLVQALDDTMQKATQIGASMYGVNNPAVGRLLGLKRAIKESELWKNDAVISFKDSTGKYPGTLRIGKGTSNGLAANPEEIRTIVASVSNFGDKIDMSVGSSTHYDMFITPNAGVKDHPVRRQWVAMGMMRKAKPGTLAYSSDVTGTVFFMDRLRKNQQEHNTGEQKTDGKIGSWWSVEIRPNSSDVLDSTIHHELGHAAHDAGKIDTSAELRAKLPPSRYGAKNNNEKFAEYMAKYIRTGEAPPWFIDLLRSKGLLKSQQN
jgi:DNA polymerase III epsilon subunit-like protein